MSFQDVLAAVAALSLLVTWLRSQTHSVKHIKGPGGGEFFVGRRQSPSCNNAPSEVVA